MDERTFVHIRRSLPIETRQSVSSRGSHRGGPVPSSGHSEKEDNLKEEDVLANSSSAYLSVPEENPMWVDSCGNAYFYLQRPLTKACSFILLMEMCERLAYYGLMPTLKLFLKQYLQMTDNEASAYIGWFQGGMYLTPVLSAVLADSVLGVFQTIFVFSLFYVAGLVLICVASLPTVSQPWMIHIGLLGLITLGSGGIKSCVNVFGAQQFHPEDHKADVTSYFTFFYASINVGGLIGGIACPQLQESVSFFAAYTIPLCSFVLAIVAFMLGSSRYVKIKPQGSPVLAVLKVITSSVRYCSLEKCKVSQGGPHDDNFVEDTRQLLRLVPICSLSVPLLIAYNQMTTAFLTQGEKMDTTIFGGKMSAALMQNVDPIVVICASMLIEGFLYPYLRARDMMPDVLTRFIMGNVLGACSVLCAYGVESYVMVSALYSVPIWWQVPQFSCIAFAEIFLISTSYEVSFTMAPDSLKAVTSAFNLLFFSLAGFLSGILFIACSDWMPNFDPNDPSTYKNSHYDYYYLLLAILCLVAAIGCVCCTPYYRRVSALKTKRPTGKA